MSISVWWMVVAASAGVLVGMVLMAMLVMSARQDDAQRVEP